MSVAQNLEMIESRIQAACERAGRIRSSVRLLAVSKLQTPDKIRVGYALGLRHFAENYAQEALDKQKLITDLPDICWHFIGRIQSNKVKMLSGQFHLIHSVESAKIADFFNRGEVKQDVLLQFNVAGEESKGGAGINELNALVDACLQHENIRVKGLMVMPPLADDPKLCALIFAKHAKCCSPSAIASDQHY